MIIILKKRKTRNEKQTHFSTQADVVLRGYSGYNTEWALSLVPEVFLPPDGDRNGTKRPPNALLTIFLGANDAALPDGSAARQHVPLGRFKKNLTAIASAALGTMEPGGLVLLISCPPVDDGERVRRAGLAAAVADLDLAVGPAAPREGDAPPPPLAPLPERTNEAARLYSRAAREVVESLSSSSSSHGTGKEEEKERGQGASRVDPTTAEPPRVKFLDLWELLGGSSSPVATESSGPSSTASEGEDGRFLSDGLHLSELGNARVFGSVLAAIAEHRPHLRASELPLDLPDHSTMDPCPR